MVYSHVPLAGKPGPQYAYHVVQRSELRFIALPSVTKKRYWIKPFIETSALQITALILHPTFPGWLAPLKFNLTRFEELASFAITLVASWIIACLLVGGYRTTATAGEISASCFSHCPMAATRIHETPNDNPANNHSTKCNVQISIESIMFLTCNHTSACTVTNPSWTASDDSTFPLYLPHRHPWKQHVHRLIPTVSKSDCIGADLPTALTRVSLAWLVSMPVAACQLVLVTAAEDKTLVGGDLFASALPLAASGDCLTQNLPNTTTCKIATAVSFVAGSRRAFDETERPISFLSVSSGFWRSLNMIGEQGTRTLVCAARENDRSVICQGYILSLLRV